MKRDSRTLEKPNLEKILRDRNEAQLGFAQIDRALAERGALVLRNYCGGGRSFLNFSNESGKTFLPYAGGAEVREAIDGDQTIVAVNAPGDVEAVSLHGEQYYQAVRPRTLWFYCEHPAEVGGETTICDGVDLWANLSAGVQRVFERHRVVYERFTPEGRWQSLYQVHDREGLRQFCARNALDLKWHEGGVTTSYACPAFVACGTQVSFVNSLLVIARDMGHLHPARATGQSIRVLLENYGEPGDDLITEIAAIAEALTLAIDWRAGDLLMIDNQRMMHGRRAFQDQRRRIFSRLSV